jgi:hypothetical protein
MIDDAAFGIDELAQHVAHRTCGAQRRELGARQQPLAKQRRVLRQVAGADERELDAALSLHEILESRLPP